MKPWKPDCWIFDLSDEGYEPQAYNERVIVWLTTSLLQIHIAWR